MNDSFGHLDEAHMTETDNSVVHDDASTFNVDELCRLLTESITSLASEANEVRLLSKVATEVKGANNDRVNITAGVDAATTRVRSLQRLHQSIVNVENRVNHLNNIVQEEKRTVQYIQNHYDDAMEQHAQLTQIAHRLLQSRNNPRPDTISPQIRAQPLLQEHQREIRSTYLAPSISTSHQTRPPLSHCRSASIPEHQQYEERRSNEGIVNPAFNEHRPYHATHRRRDSVDPRTNGPSAQVSKLLKLDAVTSEEWGTIPRQSRGRISLSVLNDALRDIAALCLSKHESRTKRNRSAKPPFNLNTSAAAKENISYHQQHPSQSTSLHLVQEQELRQSCSFFRSGESTARSILQILRSLGRLKQIPTKNGDVTYMVGR